MQTILAGLRDALLARDPLAALPEAVWKRTSAFATWGTNAIEGNTLTREDVDRLLLAERSVGGAPVRDVLETLQHDRAFRGLLRRLDEPLTARLALTLHDEVFRNVKPHAGMSRLVRVGIAGAEHVPPTPEEVPFLMERWQEEYHAKDLRDADPIELAAWMHWRFEAIHPFLDGNGRVGRLLLNHHLLKRSWPPAHITPAERDQYVEALNAGNRGDLGPLVRLLHEALGRSLLDLLDQVGTERDRLAPLQVVAKGTPHDAAYLGLRARQGFLPALKVKGEWRTSPRAVRLYVERVGRRGAGKVK